MVNIDPNFHLHKTLQWYRATLILNRTANTTTDMPVFIFICFKNMNGIEQFHVICILLAMLTVGIGVKFKTLFTYHESGSLYDEFDVMDDL